MLETSLQTFQPMFLLIVYIFIHKIKISMSQCAALKLEKSAISKVQKHIFRNFKNGKKSIFAPEKSLKLHFW